MDSTLKNSKHILVLALCAGAVAVLGAFLGAPHAHSDGTTYTVSGWAWSDTVGRVSLNCETDPGGCGVASSSVWGLNVDGSGNVSGYAWSANVGWIRPAQSGDGCPASGATLANNLFSGWLKAISAADGWDGCISLRDTTGSSYQAKIENNSSYTDYADAAWGGDVLGWLVFNASSNLCTPTFSCSANQSTNLCTGQVTQCTNGCDPSGICNPGVTITGCLSLSSSCTPAVKTGRAAKNGSVNLYWQVSGVTACNVKNPSGATVASGAAQGSASNITVGNATVFTLNCDSGAFTDTVSVGVVPVYKEI